MSPRSSFHPGKHPAPFKLLAVELELEVAFGVPLSRIALRLPDATVPEHDRPSSILSLWDYSLKTTIFYRMVLHMYRKPLFGRLEARTFRHCPALENPVKFQAKVIMKMACSVFLDYIKIARRTCLGLPLWLRGASEAAFFMIIFKSHAQEISEVDHM